MWLLPEGHIIADLMRGDIVHRHFCSWAMRPPALLLRYKPPQQASGLLKWLTGWATGSAPAKCSFLWLRHQGETRSCFFVFFIIVIKYDSQMVHLWIQKKTENTGLRRGDISVYMAKHPLSLSTTILMYMDIKVKYYVSWIITWDRYRTSTLYNTTSTSSCYLNNAPFY